jgi:N-methylhydantoinase A/oxoprolinase/acetone carboxylase beta subunit
MRHVAEDVGREPKFEREGRPPTRRMDGPASLALSDATLFVARGWRARLLDIGAWLVESQ